MTVVKSADAWAGPLITVLIVAVVVVAIWWIARLCRRWLAKRSTSL